MATPSPKQDPQESRLATRLLALIVILAGIAMVVWVFFAAKQLLEAPPTKLPPPAPTPKPLPGAAPAASNALGETALRGLVAPTVDFLRHLLTLLVMCVAGSLVAALGIRWWGKR